MKKMKKKRKRKMMMEKNLMMKRNKKNRKKNKNKKQRMKRANNPKLSSTRNKMLPTHQQFQLWLVQPKTTKTGKTSKKTSNKTDSPSR
jgi:hypothetical protein